MVLRDLLNFDIQVFLKKNKNVLILFEKSSNIFIPNACLEHFFFEILKSSDCVASKQTFRFTFYEIRNHSNSLFQASVLIATYLRWHADSNSSRYIQEISYKYLNYQNAIYITP